MWKFWFRKDFLLKVLAGETKETGGTVLIKEMNLKKVFGKIKKHQDIQYLDVKSVNSSLTVEQFKEKFPKKTQQIKSRHFTSFQMEAVWKPQLT